MGKAPALSSGSACKMDRKVSVPSNPSPARNACITGMTDSSRSSHWTRPSRYVSRKRLHWGNPKPFQKKKKINCYYSAKMHWFKSGIYNATKVFFLINAVLLNVLSIRDSWKKSSKSAYWYDFWRIIWNWRLEKWCWKYSFASQKWKTL